MKLQMIRQFRLSAREITTCNNMPWTSIGGKAI